MARCHATQPTPGSQHRQGCDPKHRQSSGGTGAPGGTPGNGINQTRQQPMNSGLLVLSVLLFVAGVTLISIG